MKRGRSTGTPTKAQRERFDMILNIGCVVSRLRGLGYVPCEIHHLTGGLHGQKRQGHDFTVGLNAWSHRGFRDEFYSLKWHRDTFGPSYAMEPRTFRDLYPDELLLETQEKLIEQFKKMGISQGN